MRLCSVTWSLNFYYLRDAVLKVNLFFSGEKQIGPTRRPLGHHWRQAWTCCLNRGSW